MFRKRDGSTTVKEVVERNTGMDIQKFTEDVVSPYIHNLKEAAMLITKYISDGGSTVTIVGDYDVDGVSATTILYKALEPRVKDLRVRVPRRFSEGYGLNMKIIEEITSGLVITVDNGIAAADAILAAKSKGLTVVVTDHHMPVLDEAGNMVLPCADIIVDPATETRSEFHGYCGAALAYRLACELGVSDDLLKDCMVLAAMATVSDVMPLTGANRYLLKTGLALINSGYGVPGIKALMDAVDKRDHINEEDFGFLFGPILNASGRLFDNGAEKTVDLLKAEKGDPRMSWMATALVKNNDKRKEIVRNDMQAFFKGVEGKPVIRRPIVYYKAGLGEGIIGIIAGQICEKYDVPCIVFTNSQKDPSILKGSGRSIPEVNMKKTLDEVSKQIKMKFGGHAGAAGLSIQKKDIKAFSNAFVKAAGEMPDRPEGVLYDLDLNGKNIRSILQELKEYAPFGEGNNRPVLRMKFKADSEPRLIGETKEHFMIQGKQMTLMGFGLADKMSQLGNPGYIDCVGYLSEHYFRGKASLRFEVIDFEAVAPAQNS